MMQPAHRHHPMNPVKHLRNAVAHHQAIQRAIAEHAASEQARRQTAEATKAGNDKLLNPGMPSSATLQADLGICRDE